MVTSSPKRLNGCGSLWTRELNLTMWTTFGGSSGPSYRILNAVIIYLSARLVLPLSLLIVAREMSWMITWDPRVTWRIRGICNIFHLEWYRWHIDARMILFLHDILPLMLPVPRKDRTTYCQHAGIDEFVIKCIEVSEEISRNLVVRCLSIIPVTFSSPGNICRTGELHIFDNLFSFCCPLVLL